jgi:hypothetical protein
MMIRILNNTGKLKTSKPVDFNKSKKLSESQRKPMRHHNNQIQHSVIAEQTTRWYNNESQQQDSTAVTLCRQPSNTNGNRSTV